MGRVLSCLPGLTVTRGEGRITVVTLYMRGILARVVAVIEVAHVWALLPDYSISLYILSTTGPVCLSVALNVRLNESAPINEYASGLSGDKTTILGRSLTPFNYRCLSSSPTEKSLLAKTMLMLLQRLVNIVPVHM